jgi:hypothetical protein
MCVPEHQSAEGGVHGLVQQAHARPQPEQSGDPDLLLDELGYPPRERPFFRIGSNLVDRLVWRWEVLPQSFE